MPYMVPHVAAGDYQSLIDTVKRIVNHCHYVFLNLIGQVNRRDFLVLGQCFLDWAVNSTHNDTIPF